MRDTSTRRMRRYGHHQQADWMHKVIPGDVLKMPSGTLRVVRHVSRYPNGDMHGCGFVIKHCSWTGRPTTFKTYTELMGWKYVGVRVRLDTELDEKIRAETRYNGKPKLSCCAVKGIA